MGKRERAIKSNASLKNAASIIETEHNLPAGCIKFIRKSGRKMRDDASVQTLRNHWSKK